LELNDSMHYFVKGRKDKLKKVSDTQKETYTKTSLLLVGGGGGGAQMNSILPYHEAFEYVLRE